MPGAARPRHLVTRAPAVEDRCITTRRIGFRARPIESKIIELDPPRRWATQSIDGPIRANVQATVEPLENQQSRLTIDVDFRGRGIGRATVPLFVVPEARREMPDNVDALKRRLDQGN